MSVASRRSPIRIIQHWVIGRPGQVILGWLLVVILAIPAVSMVNERLVVAGVVRGGEATAVDRVLATDFTDISRNILMLVITKLPGVGDAPPREVVSLVHDIQALPEVTGTRWHKPTGSVTGAPNDPDSALLLVQLKPLEDAMDILPALRELSLGKMSEIAKTAPGARLQWTGDSAIKEAIINSSNQDLRRSELRAMPLTVVMLLIAFGSLTAALIPVVIGFLAIVLTLAACFALTGFIDLSVMVQSVATLLGLALGIDYSLLMINRYRELRARHHSRQRAVLLAMRTDGRTIAISGTAVAIGFAGLTLVPVDQMRSIAFAGLLVALFAVLLATTLVPALLVCFGRKINFGQLRLSRYNRSSDTRWRRWAALVCRHPFRVMLLSSLPLLLLAISSPRMSSSFPEESWLPARTEAVQALRVVEQLDNGNVIKQLKVLYDLPDSIRVTDGEGLRALRRLHIHLKRDERAARVRSLISFPGSSLTSRALIGSLPDEVLGHYAGRDQSSTLIEVVPKSELDQLQLAVLVEELRSMDVSSVTGLGGRVRVGGLPASAVDYERSIAAWFPLVVMAVLIGSGLSLSVAFRSVLVPVKAVLLNLLAVFAAYGAVVLVFVDGFGVAILGLDSAIQGVFPATPALVFCAAFGISMDYEVFLIARIAEARRSGMDESGAIIEGVARTGPMITSAAAIMIIVFGAFVFGEVLPTQILGFALAAVVMLDALLIRVALGPAMMRIAGRYNWWPGA